MREWFERDAQSRAQLVLVGAQPALADAWYDPADLSKQLVTLAADERVIAVAACNIDFTTRSVTPGMPDEFSCPQVGPRVRETGYNGQQTLRQWSTVAMLPTGSVLVSAMPIAEQGQQLGFAILVHDLSYVERREADAQLFLLAVFGLLGIMAFGIPVLVTRRARHEWSLEVRKLLHGSGKQSSEFQPILSDMRELIARMASEREDAPGLWTAERLKQTLNRYLHGETVVILANREPYIHEYTPQGEIEVRHPASGLVTALEPIMRACSGVWVAHGSGSADRETVDSHDHVRVPPGEESYYIRRVWLSEEEQQGYYYGFANEGLWPLCHVAHARPVFRLGIPQLRGRAFEESDWWSDNAIISAAMAKQYWPGEDPIGKRFGVNCSDSPCLWRTVVGVVGDVKELGPAAEPAIAMYFMETMHDMTLVVRATEDPARLAADIRQIVHGIDPNQPLGDVRTMESMAAESVAPHASP